jgi:HlyD family secretion protein
VVSAGPKRSMQLDFRHGSPRSWLLAAAAVAVLLAAFWLWPRSDAAGFVTAPVARGELVRSINATGAVNPVVTVQVGTYVSGVVQTLECDFNTRVSAGQRCAKIDPRPYQVAVDQARANLVAAQAQLTKDRASLEFAKRVWESDRGLVEQGVVSKETADSDQSAYDQARAQVGVDEATIVQRRAALDAAQVQLDYTDIVSPVDGVVVSRNVDMGQTVAASFQTPTLFLIARDLTQMQVDTSVSESDVGAAKVGQDATFTVEAYPDRVFRGKVAQLRQAPITVQNVVTYNIVVNVDNPDLALLPGMTANVHIVTDRRANALSVPVQAVRFEPRGSGADHDGKDGKESGDAKRVWVLRDGKLVAVPVQVGIDDGNSIEVVSAELAPGDEVVVDRRAGSRAGNAAKRSPFAF